MSKFMDMIEKTDRLKLDEQSLETLKEMRLAFAEGVAHYAKKELLNDFWFHYYSNAKTHWEKKLDAINGCIERQEVKGRTSAGASTETGTAKV